MSLVKLNVGSTIFFLLNQYIFTFKMSLKWPLKVSVKINESKSFFQWTNFNLFKENSIFCLGRRIRRYFICLNQHRQILQRWLVHLHLYQVFWKHLQFLFHFLPIDFEHLLHLLHQNLPKIIDYGHDTKKNSTFILESFNKSAVGINMLDKKFWKNQ